jgi:hypothetical protein
MDRVLKLVKLFTLFIAAGFLSLGNAMAQDTEVSDEKLKAYIMVMDSVDVLRSSLSKEVSNMIVSNELMDGGRAYNSIKSAQGDTVKLTEAGITEEQLAAYDELQQELTELQAGLNETFSGMVKEHVGVSDYNKIRKGLRSDAELKKRYEALVAEAEAESEAEVVEGVQESGAEQDTTVNAPNQGGSDK